MALSLDFTYSIVKICWQRARTCGDQAPMSNLSIIKLGTNSPSYTHRWRLDLFEIPDFFLYNVTISYSIYTQENPSRQTRNTWSLAAALVLEYCAAVFQVFSIPSSSVHRLKGH